MIEPTDEQLRRFRLLMRFATERGYYNRQATFWVHVPDDELRTVLRNREHLPFLRDTDFAAAIWPVPIARGVGHYLPSNVRIVTDAESRKIEQFYAGIAEAEDPIAFCFEHGPEALKARLTQK